MYWCIWCILCISCILLIVLYVREWWWSVADSRRQCIFIWDVRIDASKHDFYNLMNTSMVILGQILLNQSIIPIINYYYYMTTVSFIPDTHYNVTNSKCLWFESTEKTWREQLRCDLRATRLQGNLSAKKASDCVTC